MFREARIGDCFKMYFAVSLAIHRNATVFKELDGFFWVEGIVLIRSEICWFFQKVSHSVYQSDISFLMSLSVLLIL